MQSTVSKILMLVEWFSAACSFSALALLLLVDYLAFSAVLACRWLTGFLGRSCMTVITLHCASPNRNEDIMLSLWENCQHLWLSYYFLHEVFQHQHFGSCLYNVLQSWSSTVLLNLHLLVWYLASECCSKYGHNFLFSMPWLVAVDRGLWQWHHHSLPSFWTHVWVMPTGTCPSSLAV